MKNSNKSNTVVLYHSFNGKIKSEEMRVLSYKHARNIAKKLLKPYVGNSSISFWYNDGIGTNFTAKDHGVLIKGFSGE